MSEADVVIIGAGVIGCAVTLELARRGLRAICVDKLPAAGYGSTSSSSAVVRFNYSTASGVAMAWEGVHYWTDWPNHIGAAAATGTTPEFGPLAEFVPYSMVAWQAPGEPPPRAKPFLDQFNVPYKELTAEEFIARYGFVDDRVFGPPVPLDDHEAEFWGEPETHHIAAIEMLGGGYITDPQLSAQNLQTAAEHASAEFRFNTAVVEIERSNSRVTGVRCGDGSVISAGIVVNVAGPHSDIINQMAGVTDDMSIRTRALRREVFVVPAPEGVDYDADGFMSGDIDLGVYFRPERGNNVLIGSAEPECDVLEWIDDPDDFHRSLSEDEYQLLVLRTSRRLNGLPIPQTKRGVVDLYDATEDWTPIYDRSSLDGFYMACGTSGNQFKNAGVAGHCLAELIVAVEAGHDHDTTPLVVTGKYTGNPIDLSTFSRLREITADSASSVLG